MLLEQHNTRRAKHPGTPPLVWDQTVADAAAAYADTCPTGHDSDSTFGENLAWHSSADDSTGVARWYDEIKDCPDGGSPCPFSMATGHYTAVVWAATTKLGCGIKKGCPQWAHTLVCKYSPPGNMQGAFEQNVKPVG